MSNKHTYEELAIKLAYDPKTGDIFKKLKSGIKKVGCLNKKLGYKVIRIGNTLYYSHRLAWILYYGVWPTKYIDHINGDKLDNSLLNLREATHQENMRNLKKKDGKSSKYKGVTWCKGREKWKVQIRLGNKNIHLGYFEKESEAAYCYNNVVQKFHKEFFVPNEVQNET